MNFSEQPPPNAPSPPPSLKAMKSHDRYRAIWNGGLICLLVAVLAYFVMPQVIKRLKRSTHRIYAISAATAEVKDALVKFDAKCGGFPSASTIEAVRRDSGTALPLGTTSSNDFFRQLIALDLIKEKPFHVDAKSGFLVPGVLRWGRGNANSPTSWDRVFPMALRCRYSSRLSSLGRIVSIASVLEAK